MTGVFVSKKPLTAAERKHIGRVKTLPCACCGRGFTSSAHHIREGQGMSQRASNWLVISLCYDSHQGPQGVHGDKSLMRIYKTDELDMLAKTIEMLNG